MSAIRRKPRLNSWLSLTFALITLGLLIWSSVRLLRETPTREVAVEIQGQGLVTARLATDPFPPLPSGTVEVSLMLRNTRGSMVEMGPTPTYVLRAPDEETILRSGFLTRNPDGAGYRAGIQFPAPGDYWLIFELPGGQQVRFQIYVEPAQ